MSEKGQGEVGTQLGSSAGAATGSAVPSRAADTLEYGQGLRSFEPEINLSDLIIDANSQSVDAEPIGGSTPTTEGTPGGSTRPK